MAAVTPKEVIDDLNFASDRISAQVRVIASGLVALVWALMLTAQPQFQISRVGLLRVAVLAIGAMVIDLAQYVVGYIVSLRLLKALETGKAQGYDKRDPLYRARTTLFILKVIVVALAFTLFIAVVGPGLQLW